MLRLSTRLCLSTGSLMLVTLMPTFGQVSVLTQHNDNKRTGANLKETVLNTNNVTVAKFGKLFSRSVDGQIYAQPLYVANLSIPGRGIHNVLYLATEKNNLYAFDADDPSLSTPFWEVNIGIPVLNEDTGELKDIDEVIGITSTPVIDSSTGTLYCVAKTKENNSYVQRLHALDITSGKEKFNGPVVIDASVTGTGDTSVGGTIRFDPLRHLNRAGLLLLNGFVYIAFGSHGDVTPWHGWVFSYNATTLQRVAALNTTPTGTMGGIWQSGQGLTADENGYIYVMTSNGTFDVNTGGPNVSSCFVKLSTPNLSLVDWFAPSNVDVLNSTNTDASAGPLLLPGTNLLVGGGKEGVFYVLDRMNMGHFREGTNPQIMQYFKATESSIWGSPIYWNSPDKGPLLYVWSRKDCLKAFKLVNGLFQTTPVARSTMEVPKGRPGAMLSLSSNGSAAGTGIVWASHPFKGDANHRTVPGILRAFDASDVSIELWNSKQNAGRDDFGNFAKFCPPTIVNGKVYLATFSNQLVVYGPLPPPDRIAPVTFNGQPTGTLPIGTTQTTLSVETNESATCRYATSPGVTYASMSHVLTSGEDSLTHSTLVTGLTDSKSHIYYVRCRDNNGNVNTSDYVTSFAVGTEAPADSGLVAAYGFSENSGTTTADASGNSNTGTIKGATWTTEGKFGSALSFRGSSVTVNDSPSLDFYNGITLEAWVNPTVTATGLQVIVHKEVGMYYLQGSSERNTPSAGANFAWGRQNIYSTSALPANVWTHLGVSYDGAMIRLYVNGAEVASQPHKDNLRASASPLRIGGDILGQYFNGRIDEVRIYNRGLTQAEIQRDMNTPVGGSPPAETSIRVNPKAGGL